MLHARQCLPGLSGLGGRLDLKPSLGSQSVQAPRFRRSSGASTALSSATSGQLYAFESLLDILKSSSLPRVCSGLRSSWQRHARTRTVRRHFLPQLYQQSRASGAEGRKPPCTRKKKPVIMMTCHVITWRPQPSLWRAARTNCDCLVFANNLLSAARRAPNSPFDSRTAFHLPAHCTPAPLLCMRCCGYHPTNPQCRWAQVSDCTVLL